MAAIARAAKALATLDLRSDEKDTNYYRDVGRLRLACDISGTQAVFIRPLLFLLR